MKTAFVTGGLGFLGRNLLEQLAARGWKVWVMDSSDNGIPPRLKSTVRLIKGDITDESSCTRALPENMDAVFHLAGNTSHWKLGDRLQTRVNVNGTRNMAAAALKRKARRFIHTSSIAAFGFQPRRITETTESTALRSRINYFRTKRLAELEVHRGIENGLDAVILNPGNIIGPHDYAGWSRMFLMIHQGKLPGIPPGKGSFCSAREVASAHIDAFERGRRGHHYLLGGADASFQDLCVEIGKLLGKPVSKKATPPYLLKIAGRVSLWGSYLTRKEPPLTPEKAELVSSELICDSDKAVREIGYRTAPLNTMLKECYNWLIINELIK